MELSRSDVERSLDRSKAAASGPSATQSVRRAKNAAHRANDVGMSIVNDQYGSCSLFV